MDSTTNIEELKLLVKTFCEERNWDQYHNAKDLVIGIITEASELLEHYRFKSGTEVEDMMRDKRMLIKISEEVADISYFLLRLCQRYDIDLSEALRSKILQNARKYPVEYAKGSNKKYTEL